MSMPVFPAAYVYVQESNPASFYANSPPTYALMPGAYQGFEELREEELIGGTDGLLDHSRPAYFRGHSTTIFDELAFGDTEIGHEFRDVEHLNEAPLSEQELIDSWNDVVEPDTQFQVIAIPGEPDVVQPEQPIQEDSASVYAAPKAPPRSKKGRCGRPTSPQEIRRIIGSARVILLRYRSSGLNYPKPTGAILATEIKIHSKVDRSERTIRKVMKLYGKEYEDIYNA